MNYNCELVNWLVKERNHGRINFKPNTFSKTLIMNYGTHMIRTKGRRTNIVGPKSQNVLQNNLQFAINFA